MSLIVVVSTLDYNVSPSINVIQIDLQSILVESRRVIFLLPVALKNLQVVEALARHQAFPLITSTLASCEVQSNRGIIQNEALIALNIIMMLANGTEMKPTQEK